MFKIRPVRIADAEQVYEIFKQTWLATYPNSEYGITTEDILSKYPEDRREKTLAKYREFYEPIVAHPETSNTLVWVAEEESKLVGLVVVDKQPPRIGALYILPQYQGLGVGKQLMQTALATFSDSEVVLNVAKYNYKAIKFYESFGFKITREVVDPNGQLPTGKVIPEVEMKLAH